MSVEVNISVPLSKDDSFGIEGGRWSTSRRVRTFTEKLIKK